ncbi:unnamed protein product [Paramecium sonneborni]|uniref:Uncharacterized protein n=1 Tax=Paramecium sonneborni TaxID=65129 RepID=A0A8S1MLP7_9CILI|nr:unnamed protein product [Paramecium sonneborni]
MQFLFRDLINKLIAQGTFNEARFYIAEMIIKSIVIIYRRKHLCIEVGMQYKLLEIDKKYFLFLYEIKTRFLGKINALFNKCFILMKFKELHQMQLIQINFQWC